MIPTLETPRLRLRGHVPTDLAACIAMWSDPIVVRHIGGRPFSREETWSRLLRYLGHWGVFGYGFWAVIDRSTGAFVGEVGLAEFQREGMPQLLGKPEVGWALSPTVHGRGYATEAVTAALAWADAHVTAPVLSCIIEPDNAASINVAGKCGFRERERAVYKDAPTVIFERAR